MEQETIEEIVENLPIQDAKNLDIFLNGMKYQEKMKQEQDKKLYSEEEVLEFTQTIIQQYKLGNTNIEQLDLLKETLELFKKNKI